MDIIQFYTIKDYAEMLTAKEGNTKVQNRMSRNIVSIDVSKIAAHAADLMTEKRVGSVIVTNNGKAFGIVTERDLVRRYSRDTSLENLASHSLITAQHTTTIEKPVEIMLKNKVRKLPIVDANDIAVGNSNSIGPSYVPSAYRKTWINVINTTSSFKREGKN